MTESPAYVVELPQGTLAVHDLTVTADPDARAVIAVHGITANGLSWRRVADEVARRHGTTVRVLAPDLRGRAASRDVTGPYGLAAHVADLVEMSSVFGASPLLVGHSMGAFIAALAVGNHPDRFAGAVLVDGGFSFPPPPGTDIDATLKAVIGPAMDRLSMTFGSPEEYVQFWSVHPALGPALAGPAGDVVRSYLVHDLVAASDGTGWVSSCVLDAVRADGADVLADPATHSGAARAVAAGVPIEFVWAHRGLLDEPQGLYDAERIAALQIPAPVTVTGVDTNHYGVILDDAGVRAVADAIDRGLA